MKKILSTALILSACAVFAEGGHPWTLTIAPAWRARVKSSISGATPVTGINASHTLTYDKDVAGHGAWSAGEIETVQDPDYPSDPTMTKYAATRTVAETIVTPNSSWAGLSGLAGTLRRAARPFPGPCDRTEVLLDSDFLPLPQRSEYDLVGINNVQAGYELARHVIAQGAKRIWYFSNPLPAPTSLNRGNGVGLAVTEAGLRWIKESIFFADPTDTRAAKRLFAGKKRPDAIIPAFCGQRRRIVHLRCPVPF